MNRQEFTPRDKNRYPLDAHAVQIWGTRPTTAQTTAAAWCTYIHAHEEGGRDVCNAHMNVRVRGMSKKRTRKAVQEICIWDDVGCPKKIAPEARQRAKRDADRLISRHLLILPLYPLPTGGSTNFQPFPGLQSSNLSLHQPPVSQSHRSASLKINFSISSPYRIYRPSLNFYLP